ncbi:response regulator [Hansschlegelia zhihuaiae]|uniref:Response regulator n=1 Tax=Hansschlegelia zhihuaiae TaxID=405005 RepID=A0A4Q0M8V9_9HYPH|nr:response regulator [Hansschlegelia zhihuaiae]RXF69620.1 response regulator [Hansschlegelia zhihuaiae]
MRVLIVEDEVVVAAEIEVLVAEAGMAAVGVAIDCDEALEMLERERPDLVLLDVHLSDGPTGVEIARRAAATHGTAVLFMTANRRRLPEDFAGGVGTVAKPYTEWGMRAALRFVSDCLKAGEATRPAPSSLELAPAFIRRWRVPEVGHMTH